MVHKKQVYNIIKFKHKHFMALNTLIKQKDSFRETCIKCHVLGWLEPGGFNELYAKNTFFYNIQCESCHGPGSLHVKSILKKDIETNVAEYRCRICHQKPHINHFQSFPYFLTK